jgi:hypothetical protein
MALGHHRHMAFGKKKDDAVELTGRWVVEHVPIMISGKGFLQQKLDEGDARGWELRHLLQSDKNNWILLVWERPRLPAG